MYKVLSAVLTMAMVMLVVAPVEGMAANALLNDRIYLGQNQTFDLSRLDRDADGVILEPRVRDGASETIIPLSVFDTLAGIKEYTPYYVRIKTDFASVRFLSSLPHSIEELDGYLTANNIGRENAGIAIIMETATGAAAYQSAARETFGDYKLLSEVVLLRLEIVDLRDNHRMLTISTGGRLFTMTIPLGSQYKSVPEKAVAGRYSAETDGFVYASQRVLQGSPPSVVIKIDSGSYTAVFDNPVTFTDIAADYWGKSEIENAASKLLVNGVGEGLYNPEYSVTRAEFITMLMRALDLGETSTGASGTVRYTDGGDIPSWATPYMSRAISYGIIIPRSGKIRPNDVMTREEMVSVLSKAVGIKGVIMTMEYIDMFTVFSDFDDMDPEYQGAMQTVYKLGLMKGMGDGRFEPKGPVTRAQAAAILMRTVEKLNAWIEG